MEVSEQPTLSLYPMKRKCAPNALHFPAYFLAPLGIMFLKTLPSYLLIIEKSSKMCQKEGLGQVESKASFVIMPLVLEPCDVLVLSGHGFEIRTM